MPVLSDSAIAQLAVNAGFKGSDIPTAVAVALAESGGNPDAKNPSGAEGLWQVMWALHGFSGNAFDPQTNANAAHTVWSQQGWAAWTTWKNGRYLVYMGRASVAAATTANHGSNSSGSSSTSSNATSAGVSGLQKATMGGLWLRVGAFLLGTLLLVEGILQATGANKTIVQFAKSAAVDAAKAAVIE